MMENPLVLIGEELTAQIEEKNANISVHVGKKRMPVVNQFVLLFYESFLQTIDEYELTRNEIRTVMKILEYARWGNLLLLSYSGMAEDLSIEKSAMYKIMKRLKVCGLIIEDKKSLYLNPQIIAKGKFLENQTDLKLLEKGAQIMKEKIGREPNIKIKREKDEQQNKQAELF